MQSQNHIHNVRTQPFKREPSSRGEMPVAVTVLRDLIAALTAAVEATETIASRDVTFVGNGIDFFEEVNRFEAQMITQALRLARGSQVKAARLLGLNPTTLNSKIKTLNISWKLDEVQQGSTWHEAMSAGQQRPE